MQRAARSDQRSDSPQATDSSPATRFVWIGALGHPYVGRTVELLASWDSSLEFQTPPPISRLLFGRRPPVAWNVQWIDVIFRRKSAFQAWLHATKFVAAVLLARLRGVRIIWTCHNLSGKAHGRVRLDRAIRGFMTLNSSSVIVLSQGAVEAAANDLPRAVQGRFRKRVVVVPLPLLDLGHGCVTERSQARQDIGLSTSRPLLTYLPGANQEDVSKELVDPQGRYDLLIVDRTTHWTGTRLTTLGWVFGGRPNDSEYGMIISASDAVLLTDGRALGSMTAQAVNQLERPLIGPSCPVVDEIVELGGAIRLDGALNGHSVSAAYAELDKCLANGTVDLTVAGQAYRQLHSDDAVCRALVSAYESAGVQLLRTDDWPDPA